MNPSKRTSSKIFIENSLPHNFLAEKTVLSCILLNHDIFERIQHNLLIETFYFKNHQVLYKSMIEMHTQKLSIDIVTLTNFLQNKGSLADIGGIKVLLDLGNQVPSFSYLNEYISIIKEKFLRRSLIKFGYKIIKSSYVTDQSFERTLTTIEQELFNFTNQTNSIKIANTAQVLNNLFFELKENFLSLRLPGLPSGFLKLDEITQGFQRSDLIIIAGRPSMGKTTLSLNIALNCIKLSQLPILFYSLEMSKEQILYRLLSTETGINLIRLKSGKLTQDDWLKLSKTIRIIAKLPFFIYDNFSLSIQEIRLIINAMILEQTQIGLVIIDYLQLVQSLDFKQGNRTQELSHTTRYLKKLAKEFNVPIIALSQLSRDVDSRIDQRPILSDLRESGSIEQDADLVLLLYNSKQDLFERKLTKNKNKQLSLTKLVVAKQRNGPTGTISLEFNKSRLKFSEFVPNN